MPVGAEHGPLWATGEASSSSSGREARAMAENGFLHGVRLALVVLITSVVNPAWPDHGEDLRCGGGV